MFVGVLPNSLSAPQLPRERRAVWFPALPGSRAAGICLAFMLCSVLVLPVKADDAPFVVGNRYIPEAPLTYTPFAADLVGVYAEGVRFPIAAGGAANRQAEVGVELAKRITDRLDVEFDGGYTLLAPDGQPTVGGFENFEGVVKYEVYLDDASESVFSVGVERVFGGTGTARIGSANLGVTIPTLYAGKGFGDLPDQLKYLRPLAVTGTLSYALADEGRQSSTVGGVPGLSQAFNPNLYQLGVAVEYSLSYLEGNVAYLHLPPFVSHLVPVVEFCYMTPAGRSFGTPSVNTIGPGVIYSAYNVTVGVEALLPTTRQSATGMGALATLYIPLDRILPATFGRPLFGH